MKLPKEEAEALRRCISILAPMHSVAERQTMALHVERRISGQENSLLAFRFVQLAALFYPSDKEKANQLAQQLQVAADAGEFATRIPQEQKGAFISDLAVWPQCPPIPSESPLRYWIPFKSSSEPEPVPASASNEVCQQSVLKKKALKAKHQAQWLTFERDFQDASANGLSEAAKAPGHGNWYEEKTLNWARQRGKYAEPNQVPATAPATPWTGLVHRI